MMTQDRQALTNQTAKKQSGFVILMGLLLLVLGAGVWFGTAGNIRSETIKLTNDSVHVTELERIKTKMLTYAVLNPEVFNGGVNNPGPGYFPCPDTDGNGQSNGNPCVAGGSLFAIGMIPPKIGNSNFTFLPSNQQIRRYWFAVDVRYLVDSPDYAGGFNRFAPLNTQTPLLVDPATRLMPVGGTDCTIVPAPAGCIPPLTLDGRTDIVMVLIYAGDPLFNQNRPAPVVNGAGNIAGTPWFANTNVGQYLEQPNLQVPVPGNGVTGVFQSVGANPDVFNDYVIAITRAEWEAAVLSRVSQDVAPNDNVPDLCASVNSTSVLDVNGVRILDINGLRLPPVTLAPDISSWFNDCYHTGAPPIYACAWANDPGFAGSVTVPLPNPPPPASAVGVDNLEGQGWRTALGCP